MILAICMLVFQAGGCRNETLLGVIAVMAMIEAAAEIEIFIAHSCGRI